MIQPPVSSGINYRFSDSLTPLRKRIYTYVKGNGRASEGNWREVYYRGTGQRGVEDNA